VFFKKPEILTLNWYFIVEASKTVLWIVDPLIVYAATLWSVEKGEAVDDEGAQAREEGPEVVVEEAQAPEKQPLLGNVS
jgi:hypothetical protein